ncbi:hypothetical protein Tco_0607126 [Tanacetum coccineum]
MEFQVRDKVMLKVLPWKGVVRFGKRGKLNPRYVGPFKVLGKVGEIAYKLELPEELSRVHNTFHVSNLKKCYADEPLAVPLEGLHFDDKLQFVEEPVKIVDREVKRLKQIRIPLIKVASDDLRDALSVIFLLFAHSRGNERQMQTTEEKVDTSKALDASLVHTKSSGTEFEKQDTSSISRNDAHADDADIRHIYDEEPLAKNVEQCHDTRPYPAKLTDHQTTELSNQSLESENIFLKTTVA